MVIIHFDPIYGYKFDQDDDFTKRFIEFVKERSEQSKGTSYEWDFDKLYPTKADVDYFLNVVKGHPMYDWDTEDYHWDDIIDWFESLPNY